MLNIKALLTKITQWISDTNNALLPVFGTQTTSFASGDVNSLTATGQYQIGNIDTVSNLPDEVGYGVLYVKKARGYILQTYYDISHKKEFSRTSVNSGSTWSDWYQTYDGNFYYSASWTATSSSASGTVLTDTITLPKGIYLIAVGTPYVQSATGLVGLRVGTATDTSTLVSMPVNAYTKASYIIQLTSQQSVYLLTQSSASLTFTNIDRGSLRAVRLCG